MAIALNKVFWGLLLIMLDINIVYFDILPDFLGYLLIILGLNNLATYSDHFLKAKPFAVILAIVTIPFIFQFEVYGIYALQLTSTSILLLITYSIIGLLHLAIVYHFMHGLLEIAQVTSFFSLEQQTTDLLRVFIVVTIFMEITTPIIYNMSEPGTVLLLGITRVSYIVLTIMLLILIRRFRAKRLSYDLNVIV